MRPSRPYCNGIFQKILETMVFFPDESSGIQVFLEFSVCSVFHTEMPYLCPWPKICLPAVVICTVSEMGVPEQAYHKDGGLDHFDPVRTGFITRIQYHPSRFQYTRRSAEKDNAVGQRTDLSPLGGMYHG
jgi:hypothetical protein